MKILITGASGKLGGYLVEESLKRGWQVEAWSHSSRGNVGGVALHQVELQSPQAIQAALETCAPQAIIHAAAMSAVADCVRRPQQAQKVNVEATAALSEWAAQRGARFIFVSTDMVFDGEGAPYGEDSPACPVTTYGRSKASAEQAVAHNSQALIVRVALMVGRSKTRHQSFFDNLLAKLQSGQKSTVFEDEWRSPLYLGDAAWILCELAANRLPGLLHAGGPERLSRFEMAQQMASALSLPLELLEPISRLQGDFVEPRQRDLSLNSARLQELFPDFRARRLAEVFADSGD